MDNLNQLQISEVSTNETIVDFMEKKLPRILKELLAFTYRLARETLHNLSDAEFEQHMQNNLREWMQNQLAYHHVLQNPLNPNANRPLPQLTIARNNQPRVANQVLQRITISNNPNYVHLQGVARMYPSQNTQRQYQVHPHLHPNLSFRQQQVPIQPNSSFQHFFPPNQPKFNSPKEK